MVKFVEMYDNKGSVKETILCQGRETDLTIITRIILSGHNGSGKIIQADRMVKPKTTNVLRRFFI